MRKYQVEVPGPEGISESIVVVVEAKSAECAARFVAESMHGDSAEVQPPQDREYFDVILTNYSPTYVENTMVVREMKGR